MEKEIILKYLNYNKQYFKTSNTNLSFYFKLKNVLKIKTKQYSINSQIGTLTNQKNKNIKSI